MKPIKVIIADDHPLMRKGLRDVIEEEEGIEVLHEAGDGEMALVLVREHKPDVAVLDIDMPKRTGIEVTKAIASDGLDVSVIILTMHDEKAMFDRAMNAGALGFVLKENAASDIVDAIRQVASGKPYVSPSVTQHLLARTIDGSQAVEKRLGLTKLSPAERKVLRLIAQGRSSNEIAEELFISPKTVGHHRTHICDKLGITGPNVLLKFAIEHKDVI